MTIKDLQHTTYIHTDKLPALWMEYIQRIRKKGHRTGILGDKDDDKILHVLLPRIKRNIFRMPADIRKMFAKYAKTVYQQPDSKKGLIHVRTTNYCKFELQRIAKGHGLSVSALVCGILENYLKTELTK